MKIEKKKLIKPAIIIGAVVAVLLVLYFSIFTKQEGDALEKYLEIMDGLQSGEVTFSADDYNNTAVAKFEETENGCVILMTMSSGDSIYFDGTYLYSGTEELVMNENGALDATMAKRMLIAAPDNAIDLDWYDKEKSGIYKILTGYKIVVVTNESDDFYDTGDTTLTLYLDYNMVPTKAVIADVFYDEEGNSHTYKTTLKYKNIGKDVDITIPAVKR